MSDYSHYVTYRNSTDQIRDRVQRVQRSGAPGQAGHPARRALARRLHSLADRLDG
jgi:hypothetical protein